MARAVLERLRLASCDAFVNTCNLLINKILLRHLVHVALLASRPRLSSRLELQKKGNRGRFPGTQLHKKNAAVASFSHIKHLRERQPRESSPLALLPGNLPRLLDWRLTH